MLGKQIWIDVNLSFAYYTKRNKHLSFYLTNKSSITDIIVIKDILVDISFRSWGDLFLCAIDNNLVLGWKHNCIVACSVCEIFNVYKVINDRYSTIIIKNAVMNSTLILVLCQHNKSLIPCISDFLKLVAFQTNKRFIWILLFLKFYFRL